MNNQDSIHPDGLRCAGPYIAVPIYQPSSDGLTNGIVAHFAGSALLARYGVEGAGQRFHSAYALSMGRRQEEYFGTDPIEDHVGLETTVHFIGGTMAKLVARRNQLYPQVGRANLEYVGGRLGADRAPYYALWWDLMVLRRSLWTPSIMATQRPSEIGLANIPAARLVSMGQPLSLRVVERSDLIGISTEGTTASAPRGRQEAAREEDGSVLSTSEEL